MNTTDKNEQQKAQSQMSQENSNNSGFSEVKENEQADNYNEATKNSQIFLNSEEITSTPLSGNFSDNIILQTIKSNNEIAQSSETGSNLNFIISEDGRLQNQFNGESVPYSVNEVNIDSIEELIESVPDLYYLRAQQILDCTNSQSHNLAVNTINLYDYVRRIKLLLEEPLLQYAECDKETIQHERTVLLEKLFKTPKSFVRAAVSTNNPLEALETAYQKRVVENDKAFTVDVLRKSFNAEKTNDLESAEQTSANDTCKTTGWNEFNSYSKTTDEEENGSQTSTITSDLNVSSLNQVNHFSSLSNYKPIRLMIKAEAKRFKLKPVEVKTIFVSLLQTVLSTVENMGVDE